MRKRIIPAVLMSLSIVAVACSDSNNSANTAAPADSTAPNDSSAAGGTAAGNETTVATDGAKCVLDSPLKIGFAADLSEVAAFSDQPGSQAAKVMVDKINDAGGVGGLPVEYTVKDIQGDPAATQRAGQELLADGVNAIIGPPFASTGAPLLDAVDGKAPIIYMASTDPALADPSRGAFLASFSDPVQSSAIAEWALGEDHTTAVTLSSSDDVYFSGNPEYFTKVFEAGGGTVLGDYAYSLADADFSTQVNAILALDKPPAILFTAMVMPQLQVLLEQLAAAGLKDTIVTGVDGFDATVVWSAGEVANGVVFAAHTFPQDSNGVQQFLDDAAAAGAKIETISFGALAADAVQILAAAATQACSVDPAVLSSTIDGLVNVPVTTGTVTYAGTGGVPEKDVVILEVKDGKPTFVEAIRPTNIPG